MFLSSFRTVIPLVSVVALQAGAATFSIATFQSDATPPLGAPLCGGGVPPVQRVTDPLSARGIVFLPEGEKPIVVCAVDWVGIGNGGHTAWREALATATGTDTSRVSVHVLHQHDAPMCDFSAEALLDTQGLGGKTMDVAFAHTAIQRAADAAKASLDHAQPVTHLAMGEGVVEKVASNRRILGPDNKVKAVRWTATKDPAVQAEPVGTIDPFCKSVSFWNEDKPLAVMTYYATHPQSHYGAGDVSADFVGMARAAREAALPGVPHIHFNGAGGNLGAGKWNDGAPENRPVLAKRLEEGMRKAWESSERIPAKEAVLAWAVEPVFLPTRTEISAEAEQARLTAADRSDGERVGAAWKLAWLNRAEAPIELARLRVGSFQFLMLPGELFVEYQLAAQDVSPSDFVCVAAYGDYGPFYIGTAAACEQGGYEMGVDSAHCGPEAEPVLMAGIRKLIGR
jgi:hypothetical protein